MDEVLEDNDPLQMEGLFGWLRRPQTPSAIGDVTQTGVADLPVSDDEGSEVSSLVAKIEPGFSDLDDLTDIDELETQNAILAKKKLVETKAAHKKVSTVSPLAPCSLLLTLPDDPGKELEAGSL